MADVKQEPVTRAELEAEHVHLREVVAEWRAWWEELQQLGQPHFGEMGDKLVAFRNELARHFTHEETSGPLVDLSRSGDESQQEEIKRLWKEHAAMLLQLDEIISSLKTCSPEVTCWGDARETFESFLNRLNAHDNTESSLLSGA